jgi:hypothetical protein
MYSCRSVIKQNVLCLASFCLLLFVLRCCTTAARHPGPWAPAVFVAAARAALHLTDASAAALTAELQALSDVSWEAGEAALTAVATAKQVGIATAIGGPPLSCCSLTKSKRYMLKKALSVPPSLAPAVLARTVSSITLRLYGCVGAAPLACLLPSSSLGACLMRGAAYSYTLLHNFSLFVSLWPPRPSRVAPYFDAGGVVCEVHEAGAVTAAGATAVPLAVAALPEPDPTDHPGFLTAPTATVTLTGLTPGTRLRLQSRCVAGGGVGRWELPWSEATAVTTMRHPRHAAMDHPPEVVRVMGTHVTLSVRNPGELAVCCS